MRPPRPARLLAPALLLVLLAPAAAPAAAPVTAFSGALERRGTSGDHQVKVWVSGELYREEATTPAGLVFVSVRRPDRGVVWSWPQGDYRYQEQPLQRVTGPQAEVEEALARVAAEPLGTEKVAGIPCRKVRWRTTHPVVGTVTRWLADGYPLPLREVRVDRAGQETFREGYTRIVPGPQPASLFELPPGAKGMSSMFGRPRPAPAPTAEGR